ncbi:MAG: hypothetical protein H6739_09640 [Alphaproteobacteria bacterium]|nr:hypothetical protein [Alphaproteobacteria bacterium]
MMDDATLRAAARAAYERGRVRLAAETLLVTAPMVVAASLLGAPWPLVAGLGAVLIGASLWMRWRGLDWGAAVAPGLAAGALGFAIPWAAQVFGGAACASAGCALHCVLPGLTGGLLAGGVLGTRADVRWSVALPALGLATLASALGCLTLGLVGLGALAGALIVGTGTSRWLARVG